MKSISTLAFIAATALVGNAIAAPSPDIIPRQYKTLTYQGCFSSGDGLTKNSSYTYNSKGYCQTQCVPADYAVQATYNSNECWCGNDLPPAADLVDDKKCNSPCAGIDTEMCGGTKLYWSVYLTGTESSAPNYDPSAASSSSSSAAAASSTATQTTSIVPSVVTVGGQTVTVQASDAAAASSSASALAEKHSSGPNKAGIAAGVVVGVVVAAAIAGGIFIFMRNRKRREVEEEYRRNAAVNNFVTGGKSPISSSSGGASFTDTRLDPTLANRRMSDGSIADNQDYSRRILKVTNA
ncbi:hypothetical protein BELL_0556g00010 [Botrytis elliptica]|uniref:WSC domain-containing protein n=1 Tax=Botrytis elliptica TaxID=278938 RepID=A0A4Z1JJX3_9HELO|nr:hypothetical protein EAE99_002445 [Botrytis elliptica]TGO71572.1 hypothetical protein BELL_0556g00010 [Botrytis elliptica]